jgi:hypothetical protein
MPETREPDQIEQRRGARPDLGSAQAAPAQAVGDVLGDVHVREVGVLLEHHAEMAPPGRYVADVAPAQQNLSGISVLQARDDAQQRRLAGAARAEEGEELAGLDRERDVVSGDRPAEPLADAAQLEDRLRHQPRIASSVVSIAKRIAATCTSSAIEARSAR